MCVPERLQHASLNLTRSRHRVDSNATVDGHRHLLHSHLTGIDINLDLDDLCSKRWRAFVIVGRWTKMNYERQRLPAIPGLEMWQKTHLVTTFGMHQLTSQWKSSPRWCRFGSESNAGNPKNYNRLQSGERHHPPLTHGASRTLLLPPAE